MWWFFLWVIVFIYLIIYFFLVGYYLYDSNKNITLRNILLVLTLLSVIIIIVMFIFLFLKPNPRDFLAIDNIVYIDSSFGSCNNPMIIKNDDQIRQGNKEILSAEQIF